MAKYIATSLFLLFCVPTFADGFYAGIGMTRDQSQISSALTLVSPVTAEGYTIERIAREDDESTASLDISFGYRSSSTTRFWHDQSIKFSLRGKGKEHKLENVQNGSWTIGKSQSVVFTTKTGYSPWTMNVGGTQARPYFVAGVGRIQSDFSTTLPIEAPNGFDSWTRSIGLGLRLGQQRKFVDFEFVHERFEFKEEEKVNSISEIDTVEYFFDVDQWKLSVLFNFDFKGKSD